MGGSVGGALTGGLIGGPIGGAVGGLSGGGGKNQPPPSPNYGQAAQQSYAGQFVNQNTPYGSLAYSHDPNSPSGFSSNISLNPQAEQALQSQLGVQAGLGGLGQSQLPGVQQSLSQPFNMQSVGDIANQAYGAFTSRLDPQWQQAQQMQQTQLANQGLVPGDQAYDAAMRDFNFAKNDAYQQANLGAIQTMPQTFQLAEAAREQPLSELQSIMSGSQFQTPQFNQFGQSQGLQAAGLQGNYNADLYNAKAGQQNALMGGLFGLGGTLGAAALLA